MTSISDYFSELDRSSNEFLWSANDLRSIKEGDTQLDFKTANSLAKGCLDFGAALKPFMALSSSISHEHVGTPLFIPHSKLFGETEVLQRITTMAGVFDPEFPLDDYVKASRESFVYQYMAVFSFNLLNKLISSIPDQNTKSIFLNSDFASQVNIDYPEAA